MKFDLAPGGSVYVSMCTVYQPLVVFYLHTNMTTT